MQVLAEGSADMTTLHIIVIASIVIQVLFVIHVLRNYRYVLDKAGKERTLYRPEVALIIPCKGIDTAFEKNIVSFYNLDYENYEIIFVTESAEDPAYNHLLKFREQFKDKTKAKDIKVLIAGLATAGGQKLHNMLYAFQNINSNIEVLAFADSDACVRKDWLSHIVHPLRKEKNGVASGYRWFVPVKNNLATLAMASMNAKVAQNLGATIFNPAWGGSMAVRVETFKRLKIDQIWQNAISDDLTITRAVKKAGLLVAFVPACLVASFEQTNWQNLFEFARRQFIITRVTTAGTWWFGLLSNTLTVSGTWGFALLTIFAWARGMEYTHLFLAVTTTFFAGQMLRAFIRQKMIFNLLSEQAEKMRAAAIADIIGSPVWSVILFICIVSSAFGRKITWRGVKYKLIGATEAVRL